MPNYFALAVALALLVHGGNDDDTQRLMNVMALNAFTITLSGRGTRGGFYSGRAVDAGMLEGIYNAMSSHPWDKQQQVTHTGTQALTAALRRHWQC